MIIEASLGALFYVGNFVHFCIIIILYISNPAPLTIYGYAIHVYNYYYLYIIMFIQCMNTSDLFLNNDNHCLVSIFSEYADEKNTDYRSWCQLSIHIDIRLYKPSKLNP